MREPAPAALLLAALAATASGPAVAQRARVQEHVEVRRVVIDVRVVDQRGDPILGLVANDFRVLVDGLPAELESVEWVSGAEPYAEGLSPREAATTGGPVAPPGRLIVYFFQADFASLRLSGMMPMKFRAIQMLATLTPGDRVAVVSFDSHLKLRLDFTDDREKITKAIHEAIRFGPEPDVPPGPFPSLAASWALEAAKRAAEPETGLLVLGKALQPLPGAKSIAYFGWGLGRLARPWVIMGRDYGAARIALEKARASVFAIDITQADFHDLEVGMQRVAADTGGFYIKTNNFPGQAITRLEGAIAGHYVVVIVKPDRPAGEHTITVGLTRERGNVLARPSYQD
jgi:VWFA-related protein